MRASDFQFIVVCGLVFLLAAGLRQCMPEAASRYPQSQQKQLSDHIFHFDDLSSSSARRDNGQLLCLDTLIECRDTHMKVFIAFQTSYDVGLPILVGEDSVRTMCDSFESFKACLDEHRSSCQANYHWKMSVRYYSDVFHFVCSEDGKAAFLSTNGSQCDKVVNTGRLRSDCQRRVQEIYKMERKLKTNRYKESGACSYLKDFRQCHIDAFSQACGKAVANFIYELDYLINGERYAYEMDPQRCKHL